MFQRSLVLGTCIALLSCAGAGNTQQPSKSAAQPAPGAGEEATVAHDAKTSKSAEPHEAALSEPDTSTAQASVLDQGNNEIDLDLTQRIRKQLMDDDALSFSAKNVKIISEGGVVTLLGSVESEAEAKEVRQKAIAEAGQGRVNDDLQISE